MSRCLDLKVSSGEALEGKDRFQPVAGNSEGGETGEAERSVQLMTTRQQGTVKNLAGDSGQGKGKEGQSEELGALAEGGRGGPIDTERWCGTVTHQGRRGGGAGRWITTPLELFCVRPLEDSLV